MKSSNCEKLSQSFKVGLISMFNPVNSLILPTGMAATTSTEASIWKTPSEVKEFVLKGKIIKLKNDSQI